MGWCIWTNHNLGIRIRNLRNKHGRLHAHVRVQTSFRSCWLGVKMSLGSPACCQNQHSRARLCWLGDESQKATSLGFRMSHLWIWDAHRREERAAFRCENQSVAHLTHQGQKLLARRGLLGEGSWRPPQRGLQWNRDPSSLNDKLMVQQEKAW